MMKIGCGTVTFRKLSLEEALRIIKNVGYEYVEPQATAPFCPHINVDEDDPSTFKKMIEKYGFKGVTALWSTHGAIIPDEKSVEYGKKCIHWAKEANIPVVNIGDGFKPEEMSEDEAYKILKERLLEILKAAEECKVYLAIEPHGTFSLTSEGLKKIMSVSDSKWLAINYDTANVHRAAYVESRGNIYAWKETGQREDEVKVLSEVVKWVKHVHVKDIVGQKCVTLGKGEVNIKGCLKVLRDNGYDGVLSLETEGEFDAKEGEKLIEESRLFLLSALKDL